MLVHQILKSKGDEGVVTIAPGVKVSEAAQMLSSRRIGSLVVSPDGRKAVGIISERDIVREVGKRGASCLSDIVDDLMTKQLVTCNRDEDAQTILTKMTEGRFRHMPVVEAGEMVGIITLGDVVKARLTELAMEKEALEGMIMGF